MRNIKKIISLILVIAFILSCYSIILAQEKCSAEPKQIAPVCKEFCVKETFNLGKFKGLNLTTEQEAKIQKIYFDIEREKAAIQYKIKLAQIDLKEILSDFDFDLSKVESKIRVIEKNKSDLKIAKFKAFKKTLKVLTPQQIEKLKMFKKFKHKRKQLMRSGVKKKKLNK